MTSLKTKRRLTWAKLHGKRLSKVARLLMIWWLIPTRLSMGSPLDSGLLPMFLSARNSALNCKSIWFDLMLWGWVNLFQLKQLEECLFWELTHFQREEVESGLKLSEGWLRLTTGILFPEFLVKEQWGPLEIWLLFHTWPLDLWAKDWPMTWRVKVSSQLSKCSINWVWPR